MTPTDDSDSTPELPPTATSGRVPPPFPPGSGLAITSLCLVLPMPLMLACLVLGGSSPIAWLGFAGAAVTFWGVPPAALLAVGALVRGRRSFDDPRSKSWCAVLTLLFAIPMMALVWQWGWWRL